MSEDDGSDGDLPSSRSLHDQDLTGTLTRWISEIKVEQAATSRARERWLRRQAAEESTLASVLLDLAERHLNVLIETNTGRRHSGSISAVGQDFVALRRDPKPEILVTLSAISSIRTLPGDSVAHSGQAAVLNLLFIDAVFALSEERPRVRIATGTEVLAGELVSVGQDVITLRPGEGRTHAYVPLDAVAEITSL